MRACLLLCALSCSASLRILARRPAGHARRGSVQLSAASADHPDGARSVRSDGARNVNSLLGALEWDHFDERSLWALEDSVPRFSLDGGRLVLWRRMCLEVPELLAYKPDELRARWLALTASRAKAEGSSATPPTLDDMLPCLEDWVCVEPGRYEGALHGLDGLRDGAVRATVEHDSELAAEIMKGSAATEEGLDGQRRWVRTRSGEIFQLGAARIEDPTADTDADGLLVPGGLRQLGGQALEQAQPAALQLRQALQAGGALLAAGGAAYMLVGHHVINMSVFIV